MKKNIKICIKGIILTLLISILPTNIYAAAWNEGLNGTEVIQLPHEHQYKSSYNNENLIIRDFVWNKYQYGHSLCISPVVYTDGRVENCDETLFYKYLYHEDDYNANQKEKKIQISRDEFDKAYDVWHKCVYNGGIIKWIKDYTPKKMILHKYSKIIILNLPSKCRVLSRSKFCYGYFDKYDKKSTNRSGLYFEIRISTNKNMKDSKKYIVEKDWTQISINSKNKKYFKAGKNYYVQIRPFTKFNVEQKKDPTDRSYDDSTTLVKDKKVYGPWSKKVKLKLKQYII